MLLVFYIRNSLRFGIMLAVKILKKNWGHGESLGESGGQTLRDLRKVRKVSEKSVNFSTLATFNITLLLVFGEQDQ